MHKDALHFYTERDTSPELFYPLNDDGRVDKFNDLPLLLRGNVNATGVPYDRHPGPAPRLRSTTSRHSSAH